MGLSEWNPIDPCAAIPSLASFPFAPSSAAGHALRFLLERAACSSATRRTPRALCRDCSALRQRGGKLVSRVELQLAEDAREVTLDRARRDEERLCDLAVGEALAGELGDPALAGRQRVEPREHDPARARAGGAELGLGLLGERSGARAVGGVECLAQKLPRLGASIAPPKHGAEVGESARSLQPGVAALERVDGLTEQGRSAVAAGHDAGGTHRHAERARGAECPRELELLVCEALRRFAVAERELGERGLRAPGEVARAGDERSRQDDADGQEVLEPFGDSSLFDPQPAAGEAKNCGR